MGYYRGDAYGFRGDYYRGDPGLFSFFGKALGGLTRGALNLAKGQLGLSTAAAIPTFRATQAPQIAPFRQLASGGPGSLVQYDGQPFGGTLPGGGGGSNLPMLPGRQRALHWNKATYVTRGGGTSRWPGQLLVHPKGTEPVPSRRMNVGNAKALRHALHRVSGFAHLARRVMSFVKPGHGRGRFKFGKKRARR